MGVGFKLDTNNFWDKNFGQLGKINCFLDYIEGDGASYIDTGFDGYRANWQDVAGTIPTDVPSVEVGFYLTDANVQSYILGTMSYPQPIVYHNADPKLYISGKGAVASNITNFTSGENVLVYGAVTSTLNGVTIADNSGMGNQYRLNAYPDSNILLFGANYNGSGMQYGTNKITYFKAYKGESLVLHLKPYIDQNGVVCMKDVLTETLYYKQKNE